MRRSRLVAAALLFAGMVVALPSDPAGAAPGDITVYPDANVLNARNIVTGPDGNLWFTSFQTARVGRIDPDDGAITTFTDVNLVSPHGITVGPDGNLWFTDFGAGRIGRITTAGLITTFADANAVGAQDITTGPDGNLWFTINTGNRIGRVTTAGLITTFPDANISAPFDIVSDGTNLWFTNYGGDSLGRVTTAGVVTNFPIANLDQPTGLVYDAGVLAFLSSGNNRLGFAQASNGAGVVSTATTGLATPIGLTLGPDDALWATNISSGDLARYDSTSDAFALAPDPQGEVAAPSGITTGPDGNIWFTDQGASVGRLEVDSTAPSITITAPADGATYQRGALPNADFECVDEDGGSGADTCVGTYDDGAPLTVEGYGEFEFTVTATDLAGNEASETITYTVAAPRCAGQDVTIDLAFDDVPTAGADVVLGTPAAEVINVFGGNDTVCAGGGGDTVNGATGADKLYGGAGVDTLNGAGGNDRAYGGDGNDTLNGAAGADVLEGGNNNDVLNGGPQSDTCRGQAGGGDRQTGCEVRTGIP